MFFPDLGSFVSLGGALWVPWEASRPGAKCLKMQGAQPPARGPNVRKPVFFVRGVLADHRCRESSSPWWETMRKTRFWKRQWPLSRQTRFGVRYSPPTSRPVIYSDHPGSGPSKGHCSGPRKVIKVSFCMQKELGISCLFRGVPKPYLDFSKIGPKSIFFPARPLVGCTPRNSRGAPQEILGVHPEKFLGCTPRLSWGAPQRILGVHPRQFWGCIPSFPLLYCCTVVEGCTPKAK